VGLRVSGRVGHPALLRLERLGWVYRSGRVVFRVAPEGTGMALLWQLAHQGCVAGALSMRDSAIRRSIQQSH
jgi:hypothetical protein